MIEARQAGQGFDFEAVLDAERARLVRLCASFLGDGGAAEDAAQETLLEAWRQRHKLTDPAGVAAWLSAIARNVCARHRRTFGRDAARIVLTDDTADAVLTDDFDFETALEQHELAALLDRALALLPADTRAALIARYIHETPLAEVAARLGVNENTVAVRLRRGKLTLRRVLAADLRAESADYDIPTDAGDWQETRIWCPQCGQHRLRGQMPNGASQFAVVCPACDTEPGSFYAQSNVLRVNKEVFTGLKTFKPALTRFAARMNIYYQTGLATGFAPCIVCDRVNAMQRTMPHNAPLSHRPLRGAHIICPACGARTYQSLNGLALSTPAGQRFWRQHPRIRTLPQVEIEAQGQPAICIRFESLTDAARLDVIMAQETYTQLAVYGGGDA